MRFMSLVKRSMCRPVPNKKLWMQRIWGRHYCCGPKYAKDQDVVDLYFRALGFARVSITGTEVEDVLPEVRQVDTSMTYR